MQDPKPLKRQTLFLSIAYSRWYWMPVIGLILSLFSIGMLLGLYRIGERQGMDFEIWDALMDIRIYHLSSHLWLEEFIAGDKTVNIQKIKDDMDLAITLAEAIRNGGKSEHGQILGPIQDSSLRKEVEEIESMLRESREISLQRLKDPEGAGVGSVLDNRLGAIFKVLEKKTQALELVVEKAQIRARVQSRRLFLGLLLSWIFVVSLSSIAIWKREARRHTAEEAMQRANKQLELQTGDLKKHKDHLTELVEERTAELTSANKTLQQEIMEREQTEQSLRTNENKFRTLVESLPQKIFLKNEESVYLYCNENFARHLNLRTWEIFGKTDYDLFPKEVAEKNISEDQKILKSRTGMNLEERWVRDGQEMVIHKFKMPVRNEQGWGSGILGILSDITEQVRLEAIAEAVTMMNNIGYIFAGVGHEVGNPINSAKMTLSVLKEKIDSYSKDNIEEYLERALGEISKVEYLLRTLKSFNMYETPKLQNVEMRPFMDKFLSLLAEDFVKRGITIEGILSPEAQWGYVDPRALQQVMLNIMNNAADAVEGKENPRIVIQVLKVQNIIRINVADNGRGISEEDQKRLFTPFFTTKSSGTGLGLVIAKKWLAKMGGTIEIKSQRDEGASVEISIQEGRDEH